MARNILTFKNLAIFAGLLIVLLTILDSFRQKDVKKLPVVYKLSDMQNVVVQNNLTYKSVDNTELKMDLYYPPNFKKDSKLPAVIFINGAGVPGQKDWGSFSSWGRLIAASGLIAVTYGSRQSDAKTDTNDLINYIRSNAASLNIDENRIGIWSNSLNVPEGLRLAMQEERKYIRCGVFYYGEMNINPTRVDVPLLIVRAGRDISPVNRSIDRFVRDSNDEGVPVQLNSYDNGQHSFDILDDNDSSREVIKQTLNFISENITKDFVVKEDPNRAPSQRKFYEVITNQGIQTALEIYERTKKTNPDATLFKQDTLNSLGYRLLRRDRRKEAIEIFKLNVAAYPKSSNVYDSLADAYEVDGNKELAIQFSEKTIEALPNDSSIDEERKEFFRKRATEKIKKLKGS
jgi:tetratricopeptide (TPR) repeat protein